MGHVGRVAKMCYLLVRSLNFMFRLMGRVEF